MLSAERQSIYGNQEPSELPLYSIGEAAHYLHLPSGTVHAWLLGKAYSTAAGPCKSEPLITLAEPGSRLLSFRNLTELHVLSAVRRFHQVKMKAVRRAVDFLRSRFKSRHPLIAHAMLTDGKDLFIEAYGELVAVSSDGQLALKGILEAHLKRIEWDNTGTPIRLFPLLSVPLPDAPIDDSRPVLIDPRVQFGKPCLSGTRIPTSIIAERHEAGDSIKTLAEDYECSSKEIEAALSYEGNSAA